jgi:P4 family phage/plasmid primase-like protien
MVGANFDREEIRRCMDVLYPLDHGIIELDVLKKSGQLLPGHFDNRDALVDEIEKYGALDDTLAIYTGLNRIKSEAFTRQEKPLKVTNRVAPGPRTKGGDIDRATGILFDQDSIRANGDKKDSTTDIEHQFGLDSTDFLKRRLSLMGWPEPLVGDSGNGGQLRYLTDLPATEETTQLLKRMLEAANSILSDQFKGHAEVDTAMHDLPRISKVFGTVTRKGPGTPERPWRLSKIISIPEKLEPVQLDSIMKLIKAGSPTNKAETIRPQPEPQRRENMGDGAPLSSDAVERLQELFAADPIFKDELFTPAPVGHRSDVEFRLCARLWEAGFSEAEIYQIMTHGPQAKWLERDDNYRWSTIKSAVAKAEASNQKKVDEKAKEEAAKKAAPIELRDVADIEYDNDGKIKKVRFSPTFAANVVLERMDLAMSEDSDGIYRFTGQIYKPDGARKIDLSLTHAAHDHFTGDKLKETLRRVKNELLEHPVVFDPDPHLLGVKNGVANLLTGEVREYSAQDLIIDQIPVSFDPAARCPAFLAFLESITPNISTRITLIDWFAATAIKEPLAYVLFLLGLGRNGKGIYEKLIKRFFGPAAFRDMPLAEVSKNNFAASGFYRKRGWIASETGKKKTTIGTDFLKLTSGNGVIDGDRKNQSRIQFEPYFQTIVDTNTMPKIDDNSIGWQERFIKIDLPYVFVANPTPENPLEKKRDPGLFAKLSTPSELSGILNLLLFRSKAIGKSGTIHKRASAEMFAEYAEQSSSMATFVSLFCEYDEIAQSIQIPSTKIYDAYKEWCGYKVGEIVNDAHFGRYLKKVCKGREPARPTIEGRKQSVYPGLMFHEDLFDAAIEHLKEDRGISNGQVVDKERQVKDKKESKESSKKIAKGQVRQVKLWNQIVRKFCPIPKKNSYKEEYRKLGVLLVLPVQTITGEPAKNEFTCPLPDRLPVQQATSDLKGEKEVTCPPNEVGLPPVVSSIDAQLKQADETTQQKASHDRAQAEKYTKKPKEDPNAPVIVQFRTDYKTEIERPGEPNAWDPHQFHEGDTLKVPFWRAKTWTERGVAEIVEASA